MKDAAFAPPLSRPIRLDQIDAHPAGQLDASQAEMEASAALLDLRGLGGLGLSYRLRKAADGRVHLSGRLTAHVVQTCVVSLEPVESDLDVPVAMEFWPAAAVEELARSEGDLGTSGGLDWPEPIRDGAIDLGPVVYETLATSLDPYPRKEGVSFEWSHDGGGEGPGPASGPFAALERLKRS